MQLAKWKGAYVLGTASGRSQSFLTELGVDQPINYETTRFEDVARDLDVVLDTLGGDVRSRSWKVLKKGGFLVSIVGPPSLEDAQAHGMQHTVILVQPNRAELTQIANLIDTGKLKVHVDAVFSLAEAAKAHELSQTLRVRGKIVLRVA